MPEKVRVRNKTRIPQAYCGTMLPVGEWITTSLPMALRMMRSGIAEIEPEDVRKIATFREGDKYKIYWLSPFSCGDGYATAAEAIISGLLRNPDVDVDVKQCWFLVEQGLLPETIAAVKKPSQDVRQVGICLATPGEFADLPTDYKIGWTMYESTNPLKVHPEWKHQCNAVEEVWVPTPAILEIFDRFVQPSKLRVMPLALSSLYRDARHGWVEDPEGRFRISMWGGLSDRKSPLEVLDIFKKVFPLGRYPDVSLTFKTRCGLLGRGEHNLPEEHDPRVRIINDTWVPKRMVDLGQHTDLFVFPTRGEGYGLPPREAILLGVPTIATKSTGMLELENENVWMVPVARKEVAPLGGEWDVPDWSVFADQLMWHYRNHKKARAMALRASDWLWSQRSPSAVATLIVSRLSSLNPDAAIKEREIKKNAWRKLYKSPLKDKDVQMILQHHEPFYDAIVRSTHKGDTLLEVGVGGGATTYSYIRYGFQVVGIDNDDTSLQTSKELLDRYNMHPPLIKADAFDLMSIKHPGKKFVAAVSQGFFEHFQDADIVRLVREQLKVADVSIFSVPSVYYPTAHVGDERMMDEASWRRILQDFEVTRFFSYGGPEDNWHFCITVAKEIIHVRGTAIKYR